MENLTIAELQEAIKATNKEINALYEKKEALMEQIRTLERENFFNRTGLKTGDSVEYKGDTYRIANILGNTLACNKSLKNGGYSFKDYRILYSKEVRKL